MQSSDQFIKLYLVIFHANQKKKIQTAFQSRKKKETQWSRKRKWVGLTCLIAVTVMTKKSGSPLVIGLVGVSMINWSHRDAQIGENKTNIAWGQNDSFTKGLSASPASFFSLLFASCFIACDSLWVHNGLNIFHAVIIKSFLVNVTRHSFNHQLLEPKF